MRFPRVKAEGQSFYHCISGTKRPAFDLATAQSVVDQQDGELSLAERLRWRIRYFADGVILGSQSFIESHFYKLKEKLGYRHRRPATRWLVRFSR
jgi:hypothetical protein